MKIIIVGDWNCFLFFRDKYGGFSWKEINYRNFIVDFMEELDLVDIYRKFYLNIKVFTYESKSLKFKFRIDYFFVFNIIVLNVKRAEIRLFIVFDYKVIFLFFEI